MFNKIEDLKILKKIDDSNLIEKCINVAKKGKIKNEVHASNTKFRAEYHRRGLEIIFADGINYQGDGYLIVRKNKKTVFNARVNYAEEKVVKCTVPPLNLDRPFLIENYIPGKWERDIKKLAVVI